MNEEQVAKKLINLVDEETEKASSPDDVIEICNEYFNKKILSWIEYKNKKILYLNNSHVKSIDVPIRMVFLSRLFKELKTGTEILILVNLNGAVFSKPNLYITLHTNKSFSHLKGKFAMYGLKPIYHIFTKLTTQTAFITNNRDDALTHLITGKLTYGANCPR